jgi:predicted amidohydrolase YtcJ
MDPQRPTASALAVRDGLIVAVGSDGEVREACDGTTEVIGGDGWAVTPGLTDGHQHLFGGAELGRGIDFDRVADLEQVRSLLASHRQRVGPGAWLLGFALEYAALGGQPYHHDLLDSAAGDGPMLLYSLDHHTAYANAEALRLAGVDGPRRLPGSAQVVCDDRDRPTGELRERPAMEAVRRVMPTPTRDERLGWYRDAIQRQNAVGLTSIHLMDGTADTLDVLSELEGAGDLSLRVAVHYSIAPTADDAYVDDIARGPRRAGRRFRADGVKFMMDGVIETGTAWLEEPDLRGEGGNPMWSDLGRYREIVHRFHEAGFRIATHAIGDRAVREVLDVYASLPDGTARHRIEHIETAPDTTVARFSPQQVTASMQPIHLRWMKPDLSDPWSQRLGPHRCAHTMRSGDLSAAGALVVLGSDWPVAPFDPRLGFFAAQLRRAPDLDDEGAIGASRPLSGLETLAGYTTNAAIAIGEEGVAGALRPGYRADFVAWAADPADCPPAEVVDLPVRATVVDGVVAYRGE